MCYLEGSKLSKKPTFKFVPIRNGIKGLAATCDHQTLYRHSLNPNGSDHTRKFCIGRNPTSVEVKIKLWVES